MSTLNTQSVAEPRIVHTSGLPVHTRFPPEPNGYLHIGHLKAILKSFSWAAAGTEGSSCLLRFDDTNPDTERLEYVQAIQRDLEWLASGELGKMIKPSRITYTSDYFEQLYQVAERLIELDLAYVDSASQKTIAECRRQGQPTPDREARTPTQNLALFKSMRMGNQPDGSLVLRLKIDPAHPNTSLRDPIAYRINTRSDHYRTGDLWAIYPSYDFSHGLIDSFEQITHSFCTHEFFIRRAQYYWVVDELNRNGGWKGQPLHRPYVEEFNRLNIEGVDLSKRKIVSKIESGELQGFDDPSLFTLAGLRRRGYPPDSLIYFCNNYVDYSTSEGGVLPFHRFEWAVREWLNQHTKRRFMVEEPLKVVITNFESFRELAVVRPDVGDDSCREGRSIALNGVVWIDRRDFKLEPEKRYRRLGPGREVWLRYYGIVGYRGHTVCPSTGLPTEIQVELLDKRKCKGTALHWVSDLDRLEVELAKCNTVICENNLEPDTVICENNLEPDTVIQFERQGYYKVEQVANRLRISQVTTLKSGYKEPAK